MKIALSSLNSKYLHPNVALRIFSSELGKAKIEHDLIEFTIKENFQKIVTRLSKYDIIAFSCYIYNIEIIKELIYELKHQHNCLIILGGPEVSYLNKDELKKLEFDYLICNEGEQIFCNLLEAIINKKDYFHKSILKKDMLNNFDLTCHYADIKYVEKYANNFQDIDFSNQIVYLETSRGCPYHCAYCQASLDNNVRNFSLEHVFSKLDESLIKKAKIVKLLDRTFNYDVKRTNEIINYIIQNDNNYTVFQFEITGELLADSSIELINSNARQGLFRFEIGVQSTNKKANQAIRRYQDFTKLKTLINKLVSANKVVLHLDLIAGLPHEDLVSFKNTFNEVYSLQAQEVQVGFLKLLKGTYLNELVGKYKYQFATKAPYQIIQNEFLSVSDLVIIDEMEHGFNNLYNKEKAKEISNYLINKYQIEPFDYYHTIGQKLIRTMQIHDIYQIIYHSSYVQDDYDVIELFKNYYRISKNKPQALTRVNDKKAILHQLIASEGLVQNEVFNNSSIEKINENSYFVYIFNKGRYYILEKEER
ncbi:DUF4080 domain-containing protein [Erysipelotrichaceae bacterium OttesenSCG-928-M19]|nr:DUF4080 domain-containing protein [Erysipelotrichaceae bacterium OttesenSCG-928-M19]